MNTSIFSSGKGVDLASATTIAPTNDLHAVTGTTAIQTITAPTGILSNQMLVLIPKGIFTLGTGGNVQIAVTAVVNKALLLFWDSVTSKWVPSYLS